jgi:YfiH family protein
LLLAQPWLEHGFGGRREETWTHGADRTWVRQIHSAVVVEPRLPGDQGDGDALVTSQPGLMLEVRTADCLPILLADPARHVIAAIHAGWRGTVGRIATHAVARMTASFGCRPEDLVAVIGPGIGLCCFEVGPEVAQQFGSSGRCHVDLGAENIRQLAAAGLQPHLIDSLGLCTVCDPARFHSFRRDREAAGRMAAGIRIRAAV